MELFVQSSGWIGTILIILAYFLVSLQYVKGTNKIYQLMNLFGAIGVGINVLYQEAWPVLVLEVTWGIIATYSLVKNKGY